MLLDLGFGEIARHLHRKADHQPRVAGLRGPIGDRGPNACHGVAGNRPAALSAVQAGGAGKEQLQMVVELGHGADRRARGANRVGLVDRDRRRHALDPVDLRLVHAVEELPCVGREGLDIATLALGIERVEHQRGFSRPGHTGHHHQLAGRNVDVEVAQIVLSGPADANRRGVRALVGRIGHGIESAQEGRRWYGKPGFRRRSPRGLVGAI